MILMVISALILTVMEVIAYPIVKLRDPVLYTYHRCVSQRARGAGLQRSVSCCVRGHDRTRRQQHAVLHTAAPAAGAQWSRGHLPARRAQC
jgi:hypothetical protein